MFPLDDFFEVSAFAFLWLLFFLLRIFYSDLRCEHLLVCHPNSSQNAWCGWLQLPDSIHFNTLCSKPFPTGFPSETISLQLSKTLFPCNSVISLNYESLQYIYTYTYTYLHIYISTYLHIYISTYIHIYIYIYIYTYIYILYTNHFVSRFFVTKRDPPSHHSPTRPSPVRPPVCSASSTDAPDEICVHRMGPWDYYTVRYSKPFILPWDHRYIIPLYSVNEWD